MMFDPVEQLVRLLLTIPCGSAVLKPNAASHHCVAWKHTCATQWVRATQSPGCSASTQGQTIQHWHWCHCTRVCCEVWESSSDIWTHLNCIAFCGPWACSIPHQDIQWDWITLRGMRYCDIYLEHDACYLRTSIKLNRFCVFGQKICELSANGKDRKWRRGGLATCVCNANEHGPPSTFSPLLRLCYHVWQVDYLIVCVGLGLGLCWRADCSLNFSQKTG